MNSKTSLDRDNELTTDQKCEFIDHIHEDESYYSEAKELFDRELLLRSKLFESRPETKSSVPVKRSGLLSTIIQFFWRPIGFVAVATVCAIVIIAIHTGQRPNYQLNRFLIYRPDVSMVEITGSFTDWKRVPLQKIGHSGYWETFLNLTIGEHRYIYILDGDKPYADPTVLSVEKDDFGGINSIITIENKP